MAECQFTIAPMSLCKWVKSYGTRQLRNGAIIFHAEFSNKVELLASYRRGPDNSKRILRVFDKEFETAWDDGLCMQFDIVSSQYEYIGLGVTVRTEWLYNVLGNVTLFQGGRVLWNGCDLSTERAKREYAKALTLG